MKASTNGALALMMSAALAAGGCASAEQPAPKEAPPSGKAAQAGGEQAENGSAEEQEKLECKGPPVTLAFHWPSRFEARVQSVEAIEIQDSRREEPARQVLPTKHRLVVRPGSDGRLQMRFEVVGQGRARLDGLLMEYGGVRPTLVLSADDGQVVGLEGVDAMRAKNDEVRQEQGLSDEESKQILERLETPTLLDDTRAWWNLALAGWAGRTLGCDEAQKSEYDMPIETLGGAKVPMQLEWRYLGSTPCEEESGRGGEQCAELLVVGSADSDQTRDMLQKRIEAIGGEDAKGIQVKRAELVRLVRVRLEPKTMILHGIRAEEHIGSTFLTPSGDMAGRRQSDMHQLAFQYGDDALDSSGESREVGGSKPR